MNATEFELVVSDGKRPLWKTLAAAVIFTFLVYHFCNCAYIVYAFNPDEDFYREFARSLDGMALLFTIAVFLATTTTILIDIDTNKLITRYEIGIVRINRQTIVPELDYVAVFLDPQNLYQVNLWYAKNKHYKMGALENKADAFHFAHHVSKKLNIDIFDATERGNFHRLERERE